MKQFKKILFLLLFISCCEKKLEHEAYFIDMAEKVTDYLEKNKDNDLPSISSGIVSNGKLVNGKLFPYRGENFYYFDPYSYLKNHAYLNDKVKEAVLDAYTEFGTLLPEQKFCIMECSQKGGREIVGHKTHQNGLSIDFMMPLLQNNKPYYKLDSIGWKHYSLTFDDDGKYSVDKSISINFNLLAQHILVLDKNARKNGMKISKVIIKISFKDNLYSTKQGKKLKNSGIYLVKGLTPALNASHDEHYHIDFEKLD